jgi:hypothetical protein
VCRKKEVKKAAQLVGTWTGKLLSLFFLNVIGGGGGGGGGGEGKGRVGGNK